MATQSNTHEGAIKRASNSNLVGKENTLVKLVSNAGGPGLFDVPAAVTDLGLYVLLNGGTVGAGDQDEAAPLRSNKNVRILATGNGSAGQVLIHDPANYGQVKVDPATASSLVFSPGIAEEDFVAGQYVLVRPFPRLIQH